MSPQLIELVAGEAEKISSKHDLVKLADTRRLKWCLGARGVAVGSFGFPADFLQARNCSALYSKSSLLANVDVPRDIRLASATRKNPWPAGDEVIVRYNVTSKTGKLSKEMKGTVIYASEENDHSDECELIWDDRQTEFANERAIFKARVPHSSKNFEVPAAAWATGCTSKDDEIIFEPSAANHH